MMMRKAVAVALLVAAFLFEGVAALGVLSSACATDADCGPGLYCFACEDSAPVCIANQAFPVSSFAQNYSLPYNKYAWITTHNAFAIQGESSVLGAAILSPKNQEDSITSQLNGLILVFLSAFPMSLTFPTEPQKLTLVKLSFYKQRGVRGLMLDIYEFKGDLWLCHSFGTCIVATAFRPLNGTFLEIESFLATNPNEVITIFIEDYVTTPNVLRNHLTATGLTKYMLPLANMPRDGSDWPTVGSMIANNQRLVVFTSDSKKEVTEGIAFQWNFVVENQYGTLDETCLNRAESAVLTDTTKSLILENYFPDSPSITEACLVNSDKLAKAITVCYGAAGNRWSNFLAVDFYKRSTAGGVFSAVDTLNGQHHCGCNDIRMCKGSTGPGSCSVVTQHAVLTSSKTTASGPSSQDSSSSYVTTSRLILSLPFLITFFLPI